MKRLPFYLKIPDDEIPYSTVTRYALLSGLEYKGLALRDVFDNPRMRIHPFFPGKLQLFANFFDLTPSQVVMERTLFPLLRLSHPSHEAEFTKLMLNEPSDVLISGVSLANAKFKTFYGFKFCPHCYKEDVKKYGFPYWHIAHQIPGIEVCHFHQCLLEGISTGGYGIDRKLILPSQGKPIIKGSKTQVLLARYSFDVLGFCREHQINYRQAYKSGLLSNDFLTQGENIRITPLLEAICCYWKNLPWGSKLGAPEKLRDFAFVPPLLRNKTHSPGHILKHLLLSCFLFQGDASKFKNTFTKRVESKPNNVEIKELERLVLSYLKSGMSFESISVQTGKSRCYLRRVAELNNINHATNNNAYSIHLRQQVIKLALLGRHRKKIARCLKVGVGYVEQIISNTPGLVIWRKKIAIYRKIQTAVREIKLAIIIHPKWRRKELKAHCNQAFFYLYHHSRNLLEKLLPKRTPPTTPFMRKHDENNDK